MESKVYLTADELLADSWRLAAKVRAGDWRPDWLVALWRGGAGIGAAVHEYLTVGGWKLDHLPLKCSSYTGIGRSEGSVAFAMEEAFFGQFRAGDRVLVVDDVFDTGRTAKAVKTRFSSIGVDMRFASVYWKPGKNATDMKPDYFVRDVGDDWLVFPHEIADLAPGEIGRKSPVLAELLSPAGSRGEPRGSP